MANHESTIKRARQNKVKNIRNKSIKTQVKNVVKTLRDADTTDSANILIKAQSTIDKAAKKGILHKKTASRKISRLARMVANG